MNLWPLFAIALLGLTAAVASALGFRWVSRNRSQVDEAGRRSIAGREGLPVLSGLARESSRVLRFAFGAGVFVGLAISMVALIVAFFAPESGGLSKGEQVANQPPSRYSLAMGAVMVLVGAVQLFFNIFRPQRQWGNSGATMTPLDKRANAAVKWIVPLGVGGFGIFLIVDYFALMS